MQVGRFLRNVTSMAAMRVVSAALSFVLVLYIARNQGADALGQFSLLFGLFMLSLQLPLLGLHVVVIRDVAATGERMPALAVNAIALSAAVAAVLVVPLGLWGMAVYDDQARIHAALWMVAASLLPTSFICVVESVLIGQQRMHVLAVIGVAENIGRTAASLVAVLGGHGVTAMFAIFLAGRVFTACAYWRYSGVGAALDWRLFDLRRVRHYLGMAPAYFGILALGVIANRLDVVLLSRLGSMEAAGMYAAPYKLYEVGLMAPTLISLALVPALSQAHVSGSAKLLGLLDTVMRGGLILGVPVALAVAFMAQAIVTGLFDARYEPAYPVLQFLAVNLVLVWIHQLLTVTLQVSHRPHADLVANAIACTVFLPALAWAIPRYSYLGAAAATTLMWLVQVLVRLHLVCREGEGGALLRGVTKLGIAAGAMVFVLYALPAPAPVALAAGLLAYVATLWTLDAVPADIVDYGRGLRMQARS